MDALEQALKLDIRKKIYIVIKKNPGLHFREIQRRVGIATGALQYHLDYLVKKHLIRTEREKKFLRYYLIRETFDETVLMALLRQDTMRKIVVFLMGKRFAHVNTISRSVGLSVSTVSWHLEKLVEAGFAEKRKMRKKFFYSLKEKDRIASLLVGYRKSFLDSVVDNFVEMWEEI